MAPEHNQKAISLSEYRKRRVLKRSYGGPLDLSAVAHMTGTQILSQILELDNPKEAIRTLSPPDYYWLVKKIGDDDCLPILEMGSPEQWHHVMDLEIWQRDRIDLAQASWWIKRLQLANPRELAKWFYTEAQHLAYYYFFKKLEVRLIGHDDPVDLPEGFFTLDGVFYVRAKDSELMEMVKRILEEMASLDLERYHSMLLGISGVLPAELEEEMFRLRNVRVAEWGFLPFDEAMSVYSALPHEALDKGKDNRDSGVVRVDDDLRSIIPVIPFSHTRQSSVLAKVAQHSQDYQFLDRLRLEFAGLCNQILSADGLRIEDFEVLIKTCRKAAGYIDVALEGISGKDIQIAERILRRNSLLKLFRVGFGMALRVKWDTQKWMRQSWFGRKGLELDFWGDRWAGVLSGLISDKPLWYVGDKESELYRDFECLEELEEARMISMRCRLLDRLMDHFSGSEEIQDVERGEEITFYNVLFTCWAHDVLGETRSLSPLGMQDTRALFTRLRSKDSKMPYRMMGYKQRFIDYFLIDTLSLDQEEEEILAQTLASLWEEFRKEYQWIKAEDLDPRFSKFIRIRPSL